MTSSSSSFLLWNFFTALLLVARAPTILLLAAAAARRPPPLAAALAIPVRTENIAGVWRLSSRVSFLPKKTTPTTIVDEARGDDEASAISAGGDEDEALLVLNADGTFAPCRGGRDDDESPITFLLGGSPRGSWHYDPAGGGEEVTLVPDRPDGEDGRNVHDCVLRGTVTAASASAPAEEEDASASEEDAFLTVADGTVAVGRCVYPRTHPNFFDEPGPLYRPTAVGTFRMTQVLGSLNTDLRSEGDDDEYDGGGDDVEGGGGREREAGRPVYCVDDFFGRRFLMTVEPLPPPRRGGGYETSRDEEQRLATTPLDVRVLPVEFHGNGTFAALGVNKILRGRFGVSGGSRLEMEVSLFGAGRSAPGSVYSEGRGLSHEDERSYSGEILATGGEDDDDRDSRTLFVRGSVVFGTDLGSDARPEPVGLFSMMEVEDGERPRDSAQ